MISAAEIRRVARHNPQRAALMRACVDAGGMAALGRKVNRSREAVRQWLAAGQTPDEVTRAVARASGVPKHELRPDLFKAPRAAR